MNSYSKYPVSGNKEIAGARVTARENGGVAYEKKYVNRAAVPNRGGKPSFNKRPMNGGNKAPKVNKQPKAPKSPYAIVYFDFLDRQLLELNKAYESVVKLATTLKLDETQNKMVLDSIMLLAGVTSRLLGIKDYRTKKNAENKKAVEDKPDTADKPDSSSSYKISGELTRSVDVPVTDPSDRKIKIVKKPKAEVETTDKKEETKRPSKSKSRRL